MLDAWIIEEIRREEERKRAESEVQPRIQQEIPDQPFPSKEKPQDGVVDFEV